MEAYGASETPKSSASSRSSTFYERHTAAVLHGQ